VSPVNYPASLTSLLLIAGAITGFLVANDWPAPIAAGVGIVFGSIPFVAAKVTEWFFDKPTEDGPEGNPEDPE
jgi:uncharacterized membrane protein (UPF0136 family)